MKLYALLFLVLAFISQAFAINASSDLASSSYESQLAPKSASPTKLLPGSAIFSFLKHNLIALYDDRGSWDTGVEHLKKFLITNQLSYVSINKSDVLNGRLLHGDIGLLIMPGGESWTYLDDLGTKGAENIKNYVSGGGGYIGICAGAFFATSLREGGRATGPYGIGLLKATAYDGTALNTSPFIDGMMDFNIRLNAFPQTQKIVLFGGPSFRVAPDEAAKIRLQVWSEFQQINEPAMVAFEFGKGHVFLSGPHLEIEENQTDWGAEFNDPESDWPLLLRAVEYTNQTSYR
jgi:glutamine amidotransferase-like uncharacterized protein